MTYSSEAGSWKASSVPLAAKTQYDTGLYWNGAINWFNKSEIRQHSVYYNVDEGRLGFFPLPPMLEGNNLYGRELTHYGESRGHLHLVEIYDRMHLVHVYEIERDYSGWFLKFSVDFDTLGVPRDTRFSPFSILSVVQMERDDESFLVLNVPRKIMRYYFGDGTLKKICDMAVFTRRHGGIRSRRVMCCEFGSFQYIETLFGV